MIGAIQGRQHSSCTINFLEVGKIVPGSQVHAPAPMDPVICLRAAQEYHRLGKGRADLQHRAILLCKVREERRNVAFAEVWIKQQLAQGDSRKAGTS